MAKRSWWDTLWGTPEKTNANQAKYEGPQPYSSQTDFAVGKSLNDTILAGLGGKGWGFGEDFVNRSTSPAVAQIQADLPRLQRETQDIYSARGLGRGTAVGRDVAEKGYQASRDINQLLVEAYLMNEQQKKQDEANWQTRGAGYSGQEVATRGGAASFGLSKMGAENSANMENNALTRQYAADQTSALNRMIAAPLAIGASVATGNPSFALGAFGAGGGGSPESDKLLRYLDQADKVSASPFIKNLMAGKGLPQQIGSQMGYRS